MRTITCIGGVPGTGKTTLVRSYIHNTQKDAAWKPVRPTRLLRAMYNDALDTYVLGVYHDDEVFAGTDKLSMAVQPEVLPWIRSHTSHVIFEGYRLFTSSMLTSMTTLPDTNVRILVLDAPQECLDERYTQRGSTQSTTFIRGRRTKIQNIMDNISLPVKVVDSSGDLSWLVNQLISN